MYILCLEHIFYSTVNLAQLMKVEKNQDFTVNCQNNLKLCKCFNYSYQLCIAIYD